MSQNIETPPESDAAMIDLIGVVGERPRFRQHLLMFDRVAWPTARTYLSMHPTAPISEDLRWLLDRGVVFDPDCEIVPPPNASAAWTAASREYEELMAETLHRLEDQPEGWPLSEEESWRLVDASTRSIALQLRHEGMNAVPVLHGWHSTIDEPATRTDVIELVIKALPCPSERHSVNDIVAFRDEMRPQRLALRHWMNEVINGRRTSSELAESFENLKSQFELALKLERMDIDNFAMQTLTVMPIEFAEHLIKFQWSKQVSRPFEIRKKQIELMKGEMRLPGKEVAYIVKARERFGG